MKIKLQLFVVGSSPRSRAALDNLRRLCESQLESEYELEVVDVLEDPAAAERANVLATPTLIKEAPPPRWRIVGDLSEGDVVLRGLGIEGEGRGRSDDGR
jgi:circadian clock protein KaiB